MAFVLPSRDPILVLGGTGKIGKRIADNLASAAIPTLVASRSGEAPSNQWLTGVKFDWFDKSTWENPWKAAGEHAVRAVHIIAPPIVDSFDLMKEFVDMALTKGTRRFILQSGSPLEAGDDKLGMGLLHEYVRKLGTEGKADWAALRPTWFMENFSEVQSHIDSINNEHRIYSATDKGQVPFVSADDVAECAVVLLTQPAPPHTEYLLVGPKHMTYDEVAQIIGELVGKRIKHDHLTDQQFQDRMVSLGMPEDLAQVLAEYEHRIALQKERHSNETIQNLLGRKPTCFRTVAEKVKEVWI
ncbi:hypothetical protein GE09DRAFT_1128074 [Coniochaeta sp. 2T2.1]|nr:hypothetical protein GE09DRAFT_1128074 [Coniochaeta sp. 2T2.1]